VSHEDHVDSARAVYDLAAQPYVEFVGTEIGSATEGPIDQSLLLAFVGLVKTGPVRRVADVGCGPGRVAAFLAAHGLDATGVDVSQAMVRAARSAHPHIEFKEGRLDALPFGNGSLGGAVCWYSTIYTPPGQLHHAFGELMRVLWTRGYLLLAFHAGTDEAVTRTNAHGTALSLTSYRHSMDQVTRHLETAGFQVYATAQRTPELEHETAPQAFVFARRRQVSGESLGKKR
jgi:ubiquinone/menaquinone biosynthesis C-methylase UbiE